MALPLGSRVFLLYDVPLPELYHERYVMAACSCGRGWHVIMTPDHDVYAEQIRTSVLLGWVWASNFLLA